MAKTNPIDTGQPHEVCAATLVLARETLDDELLGRTIWFLVQTTWKPAHAEIIASSIETYFEDPAWFAWDDYDLEDLSDEDVLELNCMMELVLINRALVHLGEKARWIDDEVPDERWNDPLWEPASWSEPEKSLQNCIALLEQSEFVEAYFMLSEMESDSDVYFDLGLLDGTLGMLMGLSAMVDLCLKHDDVKGNKDLTDALDGMNEIITDLTLDGFGDEASGD